MTSVHFRIAPCVPEPWRRGNPVNIHGHARVLTPRESRIYASFIKDHAAAAMRGMQPFDGPCDVVLSFGFEWPKSHSPKAETLSEGPHLAAGRFDVDNLSKAIMDALNDVVYVDDSQVQGLNVKKRRVPRGNDPFVEVTVSEWERPERIDSFLNGVKKRRGKANRERAVGAVSGVSGDSEIPPF